MYSGIKSWHMQDAPDGGMWFVSDSATHMEVIAPPGVRITLSDQSDPFAPGAVRGWRLLSLEDDGHGDPLIQSLADTTRISTSEVVGLLGAPWVDELQAILLGQLRVAASFGLRHDGRFADDDLALAGSLAAKWILGELRSAFPGQRWELPGALMDDERVPHFPEDLLSRIPAPRSRAERARR